MGPSTPVGAGWPTGPCWSAGVVAAAVTVVAGVDEVEVDEVEVGVKVCLQNDQRNANRK